MSKDSRFSKYKSAELSPLVKLEQPGESFVGKLTGDHEYQPPDGDDPVLILDFEDASGEPFAWKCSTWRAIEELEDLNPENGAWLKVTRLPNRGKSYDWRIEIVDAPAPLNEAGEVIGL